MKSQKPHQLRAKSSTLSRSLHRHEPPMIHRNHPQSKCLITFKYLGQIVQLDCEKEDPRDDIAVYQQHCGGENLCVYNGKILSGETFTIMSQRHRGFPFSLTFFLNGIQAERLSTCCEYKHKTGFKLGSKSSYFGFIKVHGAHPCYKCIVSQGKVKPVQQYNPHVPSNSRNSKNMRRRRRQLIKSQLSCVMFLF
uniref:DUF4590 domain-containing protein n=1 Tax=Phallusia mammillata TaxID=59560 RepID=A0A6F9DVP0_9ASCI|nr:putative protein TPRXL [Phallusia mammillata]